MSKSPTLLPGLRSRMGDWWYYITSMTFNEVNSWIKKVNEIHERQELKTWIQRDLRPERLEQISEYLRSQKQHLFNALVVGIYGGEPDWYPLEIGMNPAMPSLQLDERAKTSFGFLYLSGNEQIFAIDGQHRVEGIKLAVASKASLGDDQQSVIFVSHKQTDQGRIRTRRLFTTLNKYAKPVSKGEIIALSEDDTFAIVTRNLINDYPHLSIKLAPLTRTSNIPLNNNKCLTTALGLRDLVRTISLPLRSREKSKLEIGPPVPSRTEEIYKLTSRFLDLLRKLFPEIKEVTDDHSENGLAGKYRNKGGGHLLFRPIGMSAFTRATRILIDRRKKLEDAVALLSKATFDLNTPPWPGVLWNSVAHKMINKNGLLAQNLLLYMADQPLEPNDYDLQAEYRRALDDRNATLRGIKKSS